LRIRPENEEEHAYSNINIIKVENSTSVKIVSPTEYNYFIDGSKYLYNDKGLEVTKTKEQDFKFDYIFNKNSNQNEVFQKSASFLVDNIFDGFNSTIFAYGASGTGKTYTMFGTWEQPGIVIRVINQILNIMETNGLNKDYDLVR
jgi:kinesin family protein 18/19